MDIRPLFLPLPGHPTFQSLTVFSGQGLTAAPVDTLLMLSIVKASMACLTEEYYLEEFCINKQALHFIYWVLYHR